MDLDILKASKIGPAVFSFFNSTREHNLNSGDLGAEKIYGIFVDQIDAAVKELVNQIRDAKDQRDNVEIRDAHSKLNKLRGELEPVKKYITYDFSTVELLVNHYL